MSNGVSLIVYVNTGRNKNTSDCLGGVSNLATGVRRCGTTWCQFSACRFVYALGFFSLLVLILNSIPAIEGHKICKKNPFLFIKESPINKLKLLLCITL